jgi:hypothetical protein
MRLYKAGMAAALTAALFQGCATRYERISAPKVVVEYERGSIAKMRIPRYTQTIKANFTGKSLEKSKLVHEYTSYTENGELRTNVWRVIFICNKETLVLDGREKYAKYVGIGKYPDGREFVWTDQGTIIYKGNDGITKANLSQESLEMLKRKAGLGKK